MPLATYQQTSFLGGEWSPFYQGRADHKNYRTAMNVCRNSFPMEEGTWVRRPGTRLKAPTFKNQSAIIKPVEFSADEPYQVEMTDSAFRFFQGHSLVYTTDGPQSVTSISSANPAVVLLGSAVTWATDDEIAFTFDAAHPSGSLPLRQRTFLVTKVDTTHFSLRDSLTNANIDGSTLAIAGGTVITARRVLRVATPYTSGSWATNRIVQNQDIALVVNRAFPPQVLTITPGTIAGTADATLAPAPRHDGPYLDPVPNSVATPSAATGSITVTVAFAAWSATKTYGLGDYVSSGGNSYKSLQDGNLNQAVGTAAFWVQVNNGVAVTGANLPLGASYTGFQATDVGRHIRLYCTPPDWAAATTYTANQHVTRNDQAYRCCVASSVGQDPLDGIGSTASDTGLVWVPVTGQQIWTWGTITAVGGTNSVTVQIRGDDLLKYNGAGTPPPLTLWRLGVFSDTTFYPASGAFYEGRFWLGGCVPNRFDTTQSQGFNKDGVLTFAPTEKDGTVTDASGMSFVLQSRDANEIVWFEPDQNDVVCGTLGGEWMIQASSVGEPITPTSIRARRVTKYGCANIEPVRTGLSLVFVQKYARRVMEFLSDVFTNRYIAPHLNEAAKHLTTGGVRQVAYQEELAPIVWCRVGTD